MSESCNSCPKNFPHKLLHVIGVESRLKIYRVESRLKINRGAWILATKINQISVKIDELGQKTKQRKVYIIHVACPFLLSAQNYPDVLIFYEIEP